MDGRGRTAILLAAVQATDLIVTRISSKYGDAHLDHLGVPPPLRPVLPFVKLAAVTALVASSNHPRMRSATAAALVAYYSAATTFHVLSGDRATVGMPAVACGVVASTIV